MRSTSLWIVCCLLNANFAKCKQPDTPLMATLKSVSKETDASCIVVLHTVHQMENDRRRIFDLIKSMAMDFVIDVSITTLTFEKFVETLHNHDFYLDCKSPLILILHDDEETRNELLTVSYNLVMHDTMWFVYANVAIDTWFRDINIPFSCFFVVAHEKNATYVEMYEIYRVAPDKPLRAPIFGFWSPTGYSVLPDMIYNRRKNLEGMLFRTGSTQNYPIHYFIENPQTGEPELVGYFPAVWKELEALINFTSIHFSSVDNVTGIQEKNGSWNGLIGMLLTDQIDVAVSEFIMDSQRSHVVDFSRPLAKSSYQIFFKNVGDNHNWDAILRPFKGDVWLATLIWVLVGSCVFAFLHFKSCNYQLENKARTGDFSLTNSFFFHLKALCGQGHHIVPAGIPCRIVYIAAYLINCVLVPSYAASLISYLTFRTPKRPFDDLLGMLNSKSYRLQTNSKTAEYTYFSEASNPVLQRIYRELMVDIPMEDLPLNTQDALDRVCRDSHLAHFGDLLVASTYIEPAKIEKNCHIVTFSQPISTIYSTMALQRHSPYRMVINHFLQRMEDHGLVDRIIDIEVPKIKNLQHPMTSSVEVEDVAQAFFFLLMGYIISLLMLALEITYWKWQGKHKRSKPERNRKQRLLSFIK